MNNYNVISIIFVVKKICVPDFIPQLCHVKAIITKKICDSEIGENYNTFGFSSSISD
jgi:hypothetical protein